MSSEVHQFGRVEFWILNICCCFSAGRRSGKNQDKYSKYDMPKSMSCWRHWLEFLKISRQISLGMWSISAAVIYDFYVFLKYEFAPRIASDRHFEWLELFINSLEDIWRYSNLKGFISSQLLPSCWYYWKMWLNQWIVENWCCEGNVCVLYANYYLA